MAKAQCQVCGNLKMATNARGFFYCQGSKENPHDMLIVAKNHKATKEKIKNTEFKFVNCSLSEGEMKDAKAWLQADFDLSSAIAELLGEGYKISLTCNLDNETYQCTFSAGYVGMVNASLMLSAFAPSWEFALGICYYKHEFKLERNWSTAVVDKVGTPKWG